MAYLLTYTRQPLDGMIYGPRLAYSMHLAVSRDGKAFQALNHNSGVLFAKATENEDGSLNPKSLKSPWLFALPEGRFAVAAVRIGGDGDDDEESRGCVLLFTSKDLLEYEEAGLLKLGTEFIEQIACGYEQESGSIRLVWRERTGECFTARIREPEDLQLACVPEVMEPDRAWEVFTGGLLKDLSDAGIQGAVPHNIVEIAEAGEEGFCGKIPAKTADRLCKKLLTPVNVGIRFPEQIQVSEPEQLGQYMAEALYSDGTSARKCVDWDLSRVDFQKKGSFSIRGRVLQEHFAFPVACNRADPCIGRWKGKYYFIATNDADDNHTLYIREADTISGLAEAEEHLILDSHTHPGIGGLLWAP